MRSRANAVRSGDLRRYDEPVPPDGGRSPSPYDEIDAVYAAARDLCANGALDGEDLSETIYADNHSVPNVEKVLSLAKSLQSDSSTQANPVNAAPFPAQSTGGM